MKCSDRACPFPALSEGFCRHHWELAHPVDRYADVDALRMRYLAASKARGEAASDYQPKRGKDGKERNRKPKPLTENEQADHIALVNLIAEERVKIEFEAPATFAEIQIFGTGE